MPEAKTSFHTKLGILTLMQGKYRLCPHSKIMMIMHKRQVQQKIWEKISISARNSLE